MYPQEIAIDKVNEGLTPRFSLIERSREYPSPLPTRIFSGERDLWLTIRMIYTFDYEPSLPAFMTRPC